MALNIFKKKKKEEKKEKEIQSEPKLIKGNFKQAWRVLKSPHISEKSTDLAKSNQYIFKVFPKANKTEVKKAIESLYKVEVEKVRIIKIPKKRRRLGRIEGFKKGHKKAIVKIKEGQKIEILPR